MLEVPVIFFKICPICAHDLYFLSNTRNYLLSADL